MPNGEAVRKQQSNMKTNLTPLLIATCLAISPCAYAQEGFIRPELSYNFADLSVSSNPGVDLKDAVGYGVAGGARFGAQNEHEISLSVGILDFSTTSSDPAAAISGKIKTVPILANYRYYFGAKADSMRCYLAPSAGYSDVKVDTTVTVGNNTARFSSSGTDFTWGAGLGLLFKVADKVDMDLGYRYQEVKESDGKLKVNTVYAGINFRF